MLQTFVDTSAVHKHRTGTSTYILHLLKGLCRSGRVGKIIACGGDSTIIRGACVSAADRIVHLPTGTPHISLNVDLAGNRSNIPAGISFFPNYFMPFGWPSPSAVTIHDVSFLSHPGLYSYKMRNWYRNRIKHTVSRAELILTVSQASRSAITGYLGIDPDRIMVLPPLDVSSVSRHPIDRPPHNKPYLLYVGTIEPRKNLLNLLQGYMAARFNDTDLILIGRPNASVHYHRKFLRYVNRISGVHYLGYQNDTVVGRYMDHCLGLVQLSRIEGFGIPLFQALAKGIPTLISDDPALRELAGGQALVSKPDDIAIIAHDLIRLKSYDGRRNPEAEAWCSEYGSEHNWDQQLDSVIHRLTKPTIPSIKLLSVPKPDPERAIIEGISYASVFNMPVHADKLYAGLRNTPISLEHFRSTLKKLLDNYPANFRSAGPMIGLASVHSGKSTRHFPEIHRLHRRVLRIIISLPWIRSVYYSGSIVQSSVPGKKHDLDLFIVTRSNRVWLSYIAIRLASILSGKNRSVCCNYLVDEPAMLITWQREYYTAFQLLHLRQIARKPGTPHIRAVNRWIYDIFPNAPRYCEGPVPDSGSKCSFLCGLNLLVMAFYEYKWGKKGRINGTGGIRFDAHRIKMHTNDHRPGVYAKFQKIFDRTLAAVRLRKFNQNTVLLNGNHNIPDLNRLN